MSVSFNGLNEKAATFKAAASLTAGVPVKISANDTVAACDSGDSFVGVAISVRDGYATVVLGGYVTLPYTSTAPSLGYCSLSGNGSGGVEVTASGGKNCLVVNVDSTNSKVGIIL